MERKGAAGMEKIRALLGRAAPVRWVFTGDSITHGAAHTIGWRDYTELFDERVRWELRRTRDVIINTGISGRRVRDLADDLDWGVLQFHPDCVSLMFGMNDCVDGPQGLDAFEALYIDTIARIRDATDATILLHTPNWVLPTAGRGRDETLSAYREAILRVATTTGVPCIDHFPAWVAAEPSGAMHHWLADGCHPNEYGHRVFARAIFEALGIWDAASWTCQLPVPRYDNVP